jgi:hypothetical protein
MNAQSNIKVIAHHLDGTLIKGTTLDFSPTKEDFHITTAEGDLHEVFINELKAVFFVQTLEGMPERREKKGFFNSRSNGKKVMVEFFDGEVVFGYTFSFSPKGIGFFMIPGDPQCNNQKMFVVHAATKRVKIQSQPFNHTI